MWPQNKTAQIFPSTLGLPFGVHYAEQLMQCLAETFMAAVFHSWSGGCGLRMRPEGRWWRKFTNVSILSHYFETSLQQQPEQVWLHRRHKDRQYFGANVLVVVPFQHLDSGPNQVVQTTLTNIKFGTVESWLLMLDEFVVFEGSTALAQWHLRLNFQVWLATWNSTKQGFGQII